MLLFDKITNYSQDRFLKELLHLREQIKVKDKVNAYQMDGFPFPTIEFYTLRNFDLACYQHPQRFKVPYETLVFYNKRKVVDSTRLKFGVPWDSYGLCGTKPW
jgi:hypothetical protein